jgi:hypothetical protein
MTHLKRGCAGGRRTTQRACWYQARPPTDGVRGARSRFGRLREQVNGRLASGGGGGDWRGRL